MYLGKCMKLKYQGFIYKQLENKNHFRKWLTLFQKTIFKRNIQWPDQFEILHVHMFDSNSKSTPLVYFVL